MIMNNKRGSALLMCFWVISVLTIIGAAFGVIMVNERLATQHNIQSIQALYIAEAGLERAVYDLRQSSNWNSGNINGIIVSPVAGQFYPLYPTNINFGAGQYAVQIMNDGTATNKIWVKSKGVSGKAQKIIQAYVEVTNPVGPVLGVIGWQIVNS